MTENIIYGVIKENNGHNCVVDIENDTTTKIYYSYKLCLLFFYEIET